jgi:hypothetical protein
MKMPDKRKSTLISTLETWPAAGHKKPRHWSRVRAEEIKYEEIDTKTTE